MRRTSSGRIEARLADMVRRGVLLVGSIVPQAAYSYTRRRVL
jgi:hypothetical protein